MTGPASRLPRLARLLVALITVWCTGCAGYEALLNAALGSGDGMACASEMSGPGAKGAGSTSTTAGVAAAPAPMQDGISCACSSCHAVSPTEPAVPDLAAPVPQGVRFAALELASVTRAPLLPPPQRAA